jgi:hypothetical protein
MEASERHEIDQLPLDSGGSVRALGDRLVIEALTVNDERAARLVRERREAGQDPTHTVRDAIEVGARVLDREGTEADVEFVRAAFEREGSKLAGELAELLSSSEEQLTERIAGSFDAGREGSVQSQLKELLAKALEEQRAALLKQFSAEDGVNPLSDFKGALVRALRQTDARQQAQAKEMREHHARESQKSREQIAKLAREIVELKERYAAEGRVSEAEQAGTRKGRSFEERVHDALGRIAEARGDVAIPTGDVIGEGGSKKGDTVIEIGAAEGPCAGRIVFEDKDRKRLSKNEMRAELNGALAEREADFAVLVVAGEERIPAGHEQLSEYEGNKLIVAVDPDEPDALGLRLAYRYARLRVLMARERSLEVDAAGVRDAAEVARAALKRAQKVRLALTNIEKSTESARGGIEAMVTEVEAELARIESLIEAAGE